jgi:hypothetical protein
VHRKANKTSQNVTKRHKTEQVLASTLAHFSHFLPENAPFSRFQFTRAVSSLRPQSARRLCPSGRKAGNPIGDKIADWESKRRKMVNAK